MPDSRIQKLAEGLVRFSCSVLEGDNVLIENIGNCDELAKALKILEVSRYKDNFADHQLPFVTEQGEAIAKCLREGKR